MTNNEKKLEDIKRKYNKGLKKQLLEDLFIVIIFFPLAILINLKESPNKSRLIIFGLIILGIMTLIILIVRSLQWFNYEKQIKKIEEEVNENSNI